MKFIIRGAATAISIALTGGFAASALAQAYPTKTVRILLGYAMSTWYGAVAPVKTPREIVLKLNQEMLKTLALPDVKQRLAAVGADIVANSTEEAASYFKTELAKYTKIAQAANIRAD